MMVTTTAEALFVSSAQPSEQLTAQQLRSAIHDSLRRHGGVGGVAAGVAGEYGRHPETAAARMRWAIDMAQQSRRASVR
jgi:hypothetical protein